MGDLDDRRPEQPGPAATPALAGELWARGAAWVDGSG